MALVAPMSKYRRNTFILWIVLCLGFAAYCVYDGYSSEEFIKKHTDADGNPNATLVFNQKAPFVLVPVAGLMGLYLVVISRKKIVADDSALVIDDKVSIAYDSIKKIDRTHFDSKGHFTISYAGPQDKEIDRKLSDRDYDNLEQILDHLVAKMS